MSSSDNHKAASPKRSSGLLSSLFGTANAVRAEEKIDYIEEEPVNDDTFEDHPVYPAESDSGPRETTYDKGPVIEGGTCGCGC